LKTDIERGDDERSYQEFAYKDVDVEALPKFVDWRKKGTKALVKVIAFSIVAAVEGLKTDIERGDDERSYQEFAYKDVDVEALPKFVDWRKKGTKALVKVIAFSIVAAVEGIGSSPLSVAIDAFGREFQFIAVASLMGNAGSIWTMVLLQLCMDQARVHIIVKFFWTNMERERLHQDEEEHL
ncbi:hypothetical protein DY000_02040627, partial [Brassica cretica]